MRKSIFTLFLILLLLSCLIISCNASTNHSTPYIQYYDQQLGTATQVYREDETLLFDFGEITAWRDVDQYIHAWIDSGPPIVIPGSQYDVIDDAERVLGDICFNTSEWDIVYPVPVGVDNPLRFIAKTEKKYYLLDDTGKVLNRLHFDDYSRYGFYDGFLMVKQNNMWGYLDLNGKTPIHIQFTSCTPFYSGKAVVYIDSEMNSSVYSGYYTITTQGEMLPVENHTTYSDIYTNLLNIAEYYGIARGFPW